MGGQTQIRRGTLGLGATLLALALAGVGVNGPVGARPSAPATSGPPAGLNGSFTITVDCAGSPERTTLTNTLAGTPLDLSRFTLGSMVAPRGGEPFPLSGTLASGESRTYETGPGATVNRLSGEAIYDEVDPREGARLTGFAADLEVLCSSGSGGRAWRADPPVRRPSPTTAAPNTNDPAIIPSPEVAGVIGSPTRTMAPAPAATAASPSLPAAGAGGRPGSSRLLSWTLGIGLLLVALGGAAGMLRRRT